MTRLKLGEIAHEYKGKAKESEMGVLPIVGLEHLSSGDIDLVGFSEGGESTFTKKFLPGHVLFGRRRAYQRKASLAEFPGICSGDITVIEADEGALEPRLLPFIIQNDSLFDFAVENSAGSLSPRVKWARLAEYELDLPTLEKQRELADVLWAAQDVRRKYKQLLRASDDIVKSRFVEMFGDPVTNSKGLEIGSVTDYSENLDSMRIPITQGDRIPGPYPYIGASGAVDSVEGYIFDETLLLVSEDGANLLMRSTPIAFTVTGKTWVNNHAHVLRCHNDSVRVYIETLINMIDISEWVTGTAQPKLNQKSLNKIPIPMGDESDVESFAAFVEQVDKSKVALQQSLDELNATMAAILNEELGTRDV